MCSERSGMFSWFHRYFYLSYLTRFGWDISLYMQSNSVHACKHVCLGQIMCSERSNMFSWFHRYFDLSDFTQFGWDIGLCTQAHSVLACMQDCVLGSNYVLREVWNVLLIHYTSCSLWSDPIWLRYGPMHAITRDLVKNALRMKQDQRSQKLTPGNKKVTISEVLKLRPAHWNSKVHIRSAKQSEK